MFVKKQKDLSGNEYISVEGVSPFSLEYTLECGQAFRYELLVREENYLEYLVTSGRKITRVGQKSSGELLFFDTAIEDVQGYWADYFSLDSDYAKIKENILSLTDSEKLKTAAEAGEGIRILRQEPWETLFSFIVSQNNNIPRIRKILRKISAEYGENLSEGLAECPLKKGKPCDKMCSECGICYTLPSARQVAEAPEKLLPSKPGFRYKYLVDAAEKVSSGKVDLDEILKMKTAAETTERLKEINGVGDKVASCVALFGFSKLEAFPVDVWMKRANEVYFDGKLNPDELGEYAGIAQQYIFHYIRNLEKNIDI